MYFYKFRFSTKETNKTDFLAFSPSESGPGQLPNFMLSNKVLTLNVSPRINNLLKVRYYGKAVPRKCTFLKKIFVKPQVLCVAALQSQ